MSGKIIYNRRHFLLNSAFMAFGAAELGMIGLTNSQSINQKGKMRRQIKRI